MTVLADEQESFVRPIGITGMSTQGACLARIVRVYLDCHRPMQERLVGDHALQLGKGPFGVGRIGTPLLLARFLALLAAASFTDVCQVFQADQAVGVSVNDAFGDHMIGVLLQPSLSSTDHDESSRSGTSAFLLQTLSQSRVVVSFRDNALARMKGTIPLGGSRHGQVAYSHIHTRHTGMRLWHGVCSCDFQRDEQVELLAGFVIPELGSTDLGSFLDKGNMRAIARIGHDHSPIQGQDADLLLTLEAVVMTQLIGKRRRHEFGRLIQSFIAFLGTSCLTMCSVLLDLRPERLIGSTDLAGNRAGHLGGYLVASAARRHTC